MPCSSSTSGCGSFERERVDFTPELRQTALAKGLAGGMVGLALLVVISLLWMPLRARRRPFGRRAGATFRSVYPVVLGLGGWFLGVLIVMTTMPGTPLDDERLATLSVGVPVGLCIYWAWVGRDRPASAKTAGFAAALAGALAGAWLGFHAAADLLALVTAIVGASVGANLVLIVLDIAWGRRAGDRITASGAHETLEVRPSTG